MHRNSVGILLLLAVSLTACSIDPNAPAEKPSVDRPSADLSTLEVTVDVPYAVINRELNHAIPNQLYWATGQRVDDCPVSECSFQVRVFRNGSISVRHDGRGRVVVDLPIRTADGRIDAMKRVFGARVRKHADFSATATATVTLGFSLQPDWSVDTTAQLAFQVHQAEARVGFPGGSVGISVRKKMTEALNRQRDTLQRKIVEVLKSKVDFRSNAARAWSQLHGSWRLSDKPSVWLIADPASLQVENPTAEDAGLRLVVGVDAHLNINIQQGMPDPPNPEALPNLKVVGTMAGRYRLSLPIRLSVDEINRQLDRLVGMEYIFEAASRKITAKLIDGRVYVNGADLVVYVKVRADGMAFGVFPITVGAYFNGTPEYDAGSTSVLVRQFDYDADTNSLLLDKAEWFLHGTIRENLQASLRLDITEELDRAHRLVAENLRVVRLSEHVILHGTVDKFAPRAIYTTDRQINVDALAEGRLRVALK